MPSPDGYDSSTTSYGCYGNERQRVNEQSTGKKFPKNHSDALVIGGGIIGVCCAWELAERGLSVTLIDRGEIGHGCSYGNAGWLTPCFALPLPMPGMLLTSLKWLLNPDSPLYIKPRPSWQLIRWLWRFIRSMNRPQMERSVAALVAMSQQSLDIYSRLAADKSADLGFVQNGLLVVAETSAGIAAALEELHVVGPHGVVGREVDAAEARRLEPAVVSPRVRGGVYFPGEAHIYPLKAVEAIRDRSLAHGATILPRTELVSLEVARGRIEKAVTTRGTFTAEHYVMATGAWSSDIARAVGLNVPVLSGKGYSIIVDAPEPAPRMPVYLIDKKIAITPLPGATKLAGTLELVGLDESITRRRVDAIILGARSALNVPQSPRVVELWRGLRPCTPDGVPIVGCSTKVENLWIATGHQMLGLQTAPSTGKLVADLISRKTPSIDPAPFAPARYGN